MRKVLIISGPYIRGDRPKYSDVLSKNIDSYSFTDIELDNLIFEISPKIFSITDSKSGLNIKDFDIVMVREYTGRYLDAAYVISKYLTLHKTKFFNKDYLNYRPTSKLAQAAVFYELGMSFPATYFSIRPIGLLKACAAMNPPYIVKAAHASHGDDNFLVQTREELQDVLVPHSEKKFIIQEYLPNSHDYRVLVMGRKAQLEIKREGKSGSHLNNTSKGGTAQLGHSLPKGILEQAEQLANHLGVDLSGIDVVQNNKDGKYFFLEINFQPQIISGAHVQQKLVEFEKMLDLQT